MEITPQQKKTLLVILIVAIVVVALLLVARLFSSYLLTRGPVPNLSETMVGGKILGSKITAGQHTLEFRAKTSDGKIVTDSAVFTAEEDPYGNNDDNGDPYASPTPTQDPYSS